MPDQEFLASYAVDIDETGVERLQSILEENRSLAESLSKAFQQAYADLSDFVRQAIGAIPSLARFEEAQSATADTASKAEQAILALTSAYSGLTAAIPDASLDLSFSGYSNERNESGRKSSEFQGYLSDISGSLNRLVTLSAGSDTQTDTGGGGKGSAGIAGETDLSLNLAGASESLQTFLESLTSSEAEISAGLDLSGAEESLMSLQTQIGEADTALPLRLDRTRAEASLTDLRRILSDPVQLSADTSTILSSASSALSSVKNLFGGTTLQLKAAVTVSGTEAAGDTSGGSSDTGTSSGSESNNVNALRASAGGRYTRPTKVEVAEDGNAEYIIPVDKESDAVPLMRQALADLSASAREAVLEHEADDSNRYSFGIPSVKYVAIHNLGGLSDRPPNPLRPDNRIFSPLDALAGLPELMAAAAAASAPVSISTIENRSVEAPVNINVTASGVDPQTLGQSIYDSAQRYLQRTLRSALA